MISTEYLVRPLAAAALLLCCTAVYGQQTLANPLVRPAQMQGSRAAAPVEPGGQANRSAEQGAAATAPDAAELRRQAERRITQEDLNIRQQALNTPVLPVPLVNLFANMQVTAYFQGAIVMRKVDNEFVATTALPTSTGGGANNRSESAQPTVAAVRPISRSSAVLRLRVGKTENISGYVLRAKVDGQDISVEWLSDGGAWVNVFSGALESSAGGLPQVPSESQLLKVETDQFDYLVPEIKTRTFSGPGIAGGQTPGNFGSGFGGGNTGFNNQPGFGTGFPN